MKTKNRQKFHLVGWWYYCNIIWTTKICTVKYSRDDTLSILHWRDELSSGICVLLFVVNLDYHLSTTGTFGSVVVELLGPWSGKTSSQYQLSLLLVNVSTLQWEDWWGLDQIEVICLAMFLSALQFNTTWILSSFFGW